MTREEQIINEKKRKLKELREAGINPYPYNFNVRNNSSEIKEKYKKLRINQEKKDKIIIAGRVMTIRNLGKLIFSTVQDSKGRIQIILKKEVTNKKSFELFRKYIDSGDFIGCIGAVIKTRTGEVSVLVKKVELLSKSISPLPEKWHGLKDKEERYRKRYLDLIANPEVKEVFLIRERVINLIRAFLKNKDFVEVETPALQTLYGGAEARPFITNLYSLNMRLYLSISPELYLKKLITGGFNKVFTICKNFRNEGIDRLHNPEFTMIELYQSYADYNEMMKLTENIISNLVKEIHKKTKIKYQGKTIDFKPPFKKMTMKEAIKKIAGINTEKLSPQKINEIFEEKVEEKLIQPTFIIDYPIEICPLTKEHRKNKKLVERFELFINGSELANAYSELNDPLEQEKRLKQQIKERKKAKDFDVHFEANVIDEDFIESMSYGMPPLGGIGIGIDRLVMLLTDQPSIRDVILFPFMRPEEKKEANK